MELIHKEDVEILDNIIQSCLDKGMATETSTKEFLNGQHFRKFVLIIAGMKIAIVTSAFSYSIIPFPKGGTKTFMVKGGFKKVYEEQQKQIEYDNKMKQKAIDEADKVAYEKKTAPIKYRLTIASFIMSAIALIVSILVAIFTIFK
jgi:hypothetical protein